MIYLDNSATTKPYKEVLDTFVTVSEKYFANPSSLHGKGGEAERLMQQARKNIASLIHVKPNEVVFTSGGTEGNNIAIKGIAVKHQERGKHLITTAVEHASTYETFKFLETQGYDVTYLPVDSNGQLSTEQLEKAIRKDTILVSILHVNNETGVIQPVEEIGKLLKGHPRIFFHVDHVQGVGKVPLSIKESGIHLCTFSGHKFHGLKGTGFLYIKEGVSLSPLFTGGSQESKMRAGTENVAGFVSLAKALRLTLENSKAKHADLKQLFHFYYDSLQAIDGVTMNTPLHNSAHHIINFSVGGIKPEVLIHTLEEKEVYVSTRSACSSKQGGASRILLAMGITEKLAERAIRVSLSFENTMEEAKQALSVFKESIQNLQEVMR